MNWKIEYLPDIGIINVTPPAVVDLNSCKRIAPTLKTAAQHHGTQKFLYDYRNTQLQLKTMEIYDLPQLTEALGMHPHRQIAIVISAGSNTNSDLQFLENCYRNRGVSLHLFHNQEPAFSWLKEGSTPKHNQQPEN